MISNSLTNIVDYPCPNHQRQRATYICTDFRCNNKPFLCRLCLAEQNSRNLHYGHEQSLLPIQESIPQLSMIIEDSKSELDRLYESTIGRKENEQLLRKLQMGDRHNVTIDMHIKSVRMQLEKELDRLTAEFQKRLTACKQSILSQLEAFQKIYIQNFQSYRLLVEPLILFNRKYRYYANTNNFSLKILDEIKHGSSDWYVELKKVLTLSTKIIDKPQQILDSLNKTTSYMNQTVESLPMIKIQTMDRFGMQLQAPLTDLLSDILPIVQIRPLNILIEANGYR